VCGGCQWGSSFSKCSSADVGVEKERVWKSVSAGINQIISWLITTLPLNGMRGVQRQGPWGLFMRSRQSCLFAFAAMSHALVLEQLTLYHGVWNTPYHCASPSPCSPSTFLFHAMAGACELDS